jgi:hypothetical protein
VGGCPLANVIRWREAANRVMILSPDVGRLQIAVVAVDRVIPIAASLDAENLVLHQRIIALRSTTPKRRR